MFPDKARYGSSPPVRLFVGIAFTRWKLSPKPNGAHEHGLVKANVLAVLPSGQAGPLSLDSALIPAFSKASFMAISVGSLTAFTQTRSMTSFVSSYTTFLYTFDLAVGVRLILRLS
jgi:hypothetical protein